MFLSKILTSGSLSHAPCLSLPPPLHLPCNKLQEITQFSSKNPLLCLSPVTELRRNSCGSAAHLYRFFTSYPCYVYHSCSIHGVFMVCSYPHPTKITQFCQYFALITVDHRMVLAPFSRASPSLPTTYLKPTYYQHPLALQAEGAALLGDVLFHKHPQALVAIVYSNGVVLGHCCIV